MRYELEKTRRTLELPTAEFVVAATLLLLLMVNASNQLGGIWAGAHSATKFFAYMVLGGVLFLYYLGNAERSLFPLAVALAGVVCIALLNECLFPGTATEARSVVGRFAVLCLPLLFVAARIKEPQQLYASMTRFSIASTVIVLVLLLVHFVAPSPSGSAYSMGLGYAILPFALVSFNEVVRAEQRKSSRVLYALCFLAQFAGIVLLGSRGPIACIAVFAVVVCIRRCRAGNVPAVFVVALFAVLVAGVMHEELLRLVADMLSATGFSRTGYLIEQFLESGQVHVSGRDVVQAPLLDAIWADPLAWRGIAADRVAVGMNAHNLFIEVAYCFGMVAAAATVLFVLLYLVKVICLPSSVWGDLVSIFFSCSIPTLMFSGSVWDSTMLWIGIGLLCACRRRAGLANLDRNQFCLDLGTQCQEEKRIEGLECDTKK